MLAIGIDSWDWTITSNGFEVLSKGSESVLNEPF